MGVRHKWYLSRECAEARMRATECPSFLFLILGLLNMGTMTGAYFLTQTYYYDLDPEIVALLVIAIAVLFFVISFVIVHAFSRVAEASRLKTELVGIASHQLRTPLTNIKFSIEYLKSGRIGALPEKQKDQLSIISQSSERLLKLVSNLLDLSRIEENRLALARDPISLADITESLRQEFDPLIRKKKLSVSIEIPRDVPSVAGDGARLRMVIQNLFDNAIKYNKDGGAIAIKARVKKHNVVWRIDDTGLGIPKQDQKRVFQKFYRGEKNLLEHSYGTGLGLYIVRAIVEELGGSIQFASKENAGTSFWFAVPIHNAQRSINKTIAKHHEVTA